MTERALAGSGASQRVALALAAVKGIDRAQVRVTAVLGVCLTLVSAAIYAIPLMQIARTNPWWAIAAEMVIGDQVKAFCLLVALVIANRAVDEGYARRTTYVLAALLGCVVGVVASELLTAAWRSVFIRGAMPAARPWLQGTAHLYFRPIFSFTNWLLISSAIVSVYAGRRAALRTAERFRIADMNRIQSSKLALESRLQAMQARVEPQFLFNTLVQVERLYELDAALAPRMLADLIAYLRAAMPLMRDTSSTVAREFELARAYLDIVRMRLGERLAITIVAPPGSEEMRMPPMMLLPLIDHAIVRGFAPADAHGAISIRTEVDRDRLRLTITDSGAGFVPETGVEGLLPVRERLAALYGEAGALRLKRAGPSATEAVLEIPLERRAPA